MIRKDGETPLFDGLGSERTVTNSSQAVTASLTLSAFGQTVASSGSSTSAYQYGATSGYRTEGDAGLTLVGCRYYDAQVGRFITRDTFLDQAPYAYCDGDPVNGTDPSGHDPDWGAGGVALAAIAGIVAVLAIPVTGGASVGIVIAIIGMTGIGSTGGYYFGKSLGGNPPDPPEIPAPTQEEINHQRLQVQEYKASGGAIDF